MNDVLNDIKVLENAIINLTEGASDEKRMAINTLELMLDEKKNSMDQFEAEYAPHE
jgi:chaperonin GroEL (HSP60 family)